MAARPLPVRRSKASHWLIWFCCGPIFFLSGSSGDSAFYLAKFQAGVTPPVVLGVLSFYGEDLRYDLGDRTAIELIAFSIFGLFLWALAGLFFWNGVLVPRFRAFTGREEEQGIDAERTRPTQPPPVPAPHAAGDSSVVGATSSD